MSDAVSSSIASPPTGWSPILAGPYARPHCVVAFASESAVGLVVTPQRALAPSRPAPPGWVVLHAETGAVLVGGMRHVADACRFAELVAGLVECQRTTPDDIARVVAATLAGGGSDARSLSALLAPSGSA